MAAASTVPTNVIRMRPQALLTRTTHARSRRQPLGRQTAGAEPRHLPAATEPVADGFAALPVDIVGDTFVVDGTEGASKEGDA